MDLELRGKTVLVTGGSKGIGYAIAEQMAAEGCNVILVARSLTDLESARGEILAKYPGRQVVVHAADLTADGAVEELSRKFSNVDILVNNAGAIRHGALHEVDAPTWQKYWDLKVFGYINLTRAYYAIMKARHKGVIINIIGIGGERLSSDYIAGGSGNAALIGFTKSLGGSSPADGIRVIGVNPGPVLTDKLKLTLRSDAQAKLGDAERWPELVASMPFGRTIRPVEISSLVAFLASELSGYTSGTVFNIDGGSLFRPRASHQL